MSDSTAEFLIGLAALSGIKLSIFYALNRYRASPRDYLEFVGIVKKVTVYPVKSCRGLTAESAEVDEHGLLTIDGVHDRCIMIIKENGTFISGREFPSMVLVSPSIHGDFLHLNAPGMTELKLPKNIKEGELKTCQVWGDDVLGSDCGEEAAKWICEYLQKPGAGYRVVATSLCMPKREVWKGSFIYSKLSPEGTTVAYQDDAPCHLMSEETVSDLNTRLKTPVSTDNFRPNIVVSGCKPYDEFDWQEFYVGQVKYSQLYECERCTFPAVNPQTGVREKKYEPTTTLKKFMPKGVSGFGPTLGVMLKPDNRGIVRVGDPVYVLRKSRIANFLVS